MGKGDGTFTGSVTMYGGYLDLGTNNLKFTNPSSVSRNLTPTILEALYNGYNTWITTAGIPTSYLQRGTSLTPVTSGLQHN
jgi:hypothetical protein